MATLTNQHNFIWYGICSYDETSPKTGSGTNESGDCLPFSLNDSGVKTAWYIDESNQKKSWVQGADNNDFTELVCGNAYYISLNKDEGSISSVDIPHAVVSTENYKISECEAPIDDSPLVIDNLWIAFATSDNSTTKHSDFYEVQGVEAETVLIELDNLSAYNGAAGSLGKQKIGKGAGETMIVTQDIVDGVEVDMFGTKVTLFPWTSAPSVDPLSNLIGSVITEDGGTFTINYTAEFDYTKFKIIEDGFATAIQAEIDAFKLFDTSHVMLVKSDSKPIYGNEGYSEAIATAFNFPGEMVLKCGETWNYEDDAENQTYIEFDCSGTKFKLTPRGIEDATLNDQQLPEQDEKEWHGASNIFFRTGSMMSTVADNNPSLIDEFYFVKSNGNKVKFGDGNPKGTHCA